MAEPVYELPRKIPTWAWAFYFVSMGIFILVAGRHIWNKLQENEVKRKASAAASASAGFSALEKEAWEKALAEKELEDFRAAKDQAYMWCRNQKGVPVMGFGYTVVCFSMEAVAWEHKLEAPPW